MEIWINDFQHPYLKSTTIWYSLEIRYSSFEVLLFRLKDNNSMKLREFLTVYCNYSVTTGATITECGKALLASGAEKVFALSAALAD